MYSQNDEEAAILEAVGAQLGLFLDIGAYDGCTFSNTLALVERGWEGVLVEPSLGGFERLRARHGDNSKLQLVHALVGNGSGLVKFWDTPDALSTSNQEWYERLKPIAGYAPACWLAQVNLTDLLEAFPYLGGVGVVSIDIEGESAQLLVDWPFHLMSPKVICVEHDSREAELLGVVAEHGYREVYRSAENLVLVR